MIRWRVVTCLILIMSKWVFGGGQDSGLSGLEEKSGATGKASDEMDLDPDLDVEGSSP